MDISLDTRVQERKEIIASLHKAADSREAYEYTRKDVSEKGRDYHRSLVDKSRFFSVLGFSSVMHRGEVYKPQRIDNLIQISSAQVLNAEKEESYQHKMSTQEEAARRRGEYKDYKLDQKDAANMSLSLYRNAKADPTEAPAVNDLNGTEFIQKPDETKGEIADRMCGLLLSRDRLKEKIAGMENVPKVRATDQRYIDNLKLLLERTEDAVNTWYLANGVSLSGEKVTDKMIKNAKAHLPLALEKYKYQNDNFDAIYGEDIIQLLSTQKGYKDDKADNDRVNEQDSKANHRITGIQLSKLDDVDRLQKIITDHPDEYKKNKSKINKAFAFYAERLRKISSESERIILSLNEVRRHLRTFQPEETNRLENAINKRKEALLLETFTLEYQAESAAAYIRYLIDGEKTDPWHAEFIEKEFGEKHCGIDKDALISKSFPEYIEVDREFEARKKELTAFHKRERDPQKKAWYKRALERFKNPRNTVFKAMALANADEDAMSRDLLQETLTGEATYGVSDLKGFKSIVPALSPVVLGVFMTPQELRGYGNDLSIVRTGQDLTRTDVDQADQLASFRYLYSSIKDEIPVLERYKALHPEMLAERTYVNSIHDWSLLPKFYMKASAMNRIMDILVNSPIFDKLDQTAQEDVIANYAKIQSMAGASDVLLDRASHACDKTAAEYLKLHESEPGKELRASNVSKLFISNYQSLMQRYFGNRGRRFEKIGRAEQDVYQSAD